MKSLLWSNNQNRKTQKGECLLLFLAGGMLGFLCFLYIYGWRVLDVTYDAWIFHGDIDLRQHYVGFCHYRMDPWTFPVGLIKSLSYPSSMSVIYTDSIPIVAVLFKLISGILPKQFQYYGLYGCLTFILQGGLSGLLLRRFCDKKSYCVIGAGFFVISYPLIQRMFYHTALSSQWLILLSLLIWFYCQKKSLQKRCIIWGLMGLLCVGIHSYYLPMAGMILLASSIELIVSCSQKQERRKLIRQEGVVILSYCLMAVFGLWILGGFYGGPYINEAGGLGTFGSNLNTFVNSMGDGLFLPKLPLYYDFQYEGAAYLGVGILLLLLILAVKLVLRARRGKDLKEVLSVRAKIVICLSIFSWIFAMAPLFSIGSFKIVNLPYPQFLRSLLGIFRSNGRFSWVAFYLIILSALVLFERYASKKTMVIAMSVLLAVQVIDLSPMLLERHEKYREKMEPVLLWEDANLSSIAAGKQGFMFMYNDNDIMMQTGYYAYMHDMWISCFYFARNIDGLIDWYIHANELELEKGNANSDRVYIFKTDMEHLPKYQELTYYKIDEEHVAGICQ